MWFLKFQIAQANLWNGFTRRRLYACVLFIRGKDGMYTMTWPELAKPDLKKKEKEKQEV